MNQSAGQRHALLREQAPPGVSWAERPWLSPKPDLWPVPPPTPLAGHQVFLKSDSLCLMEGRRFRAQPTLPAARLLAMHIQQLETGGFTMTNGAHRWSKLRWESPPSLCS